MTRSCTRRGSLNPEMRAFLDWKFRKFPCFSTYEAMLRLNRYTSDVIFNARSACF